MSVIRVCGVPRPLMELVGKQEGPYGDDIQRMQQSTNQARPR